MGKMLHTESNNVAINVKNDTNNLNVFFKFLDNHTNRIHLYQISYTSSPENVPIKGMKQ